MEVFSKYFARLVSRNAASIFSGSKPVDGGNYRLLLEEMEKTTNDPDQSSRIAEAVDISDSDAFRDFDLRKFIEHFDLDPVGKLALAVAFRSSTRSDLRQKGKQAEKFPHNVY